jgi:hypothetical protein
MVWGLSSARYNLWDDRDSDLARDRVRKFDKRAVSRGAYSSRLKWCCVRVSHVGMISLFICGSSGSQTRQQAKEGKLRTLGTCDVAGLYMQPGASAPCRR